jgi:aminopeptidase N
MKKITITLSCIILFFASCNSPKETKKEVVSKTTIQKYVPEVHSYAQPNNAVITHLNLNISLDFEKEIIHGIANYTIDNTNATEIILDSKYLDILNVEADGKATSFTLSKFDKNLGQALKIAITPKTKQITVYYNTTSKTEALQWLKPQQTADKTQPFLFTQGQAILTRTWIPIQDSPQIRITYNATVKVPSQLMAVMSAENTKERTIDGVYQFKMTQPIPPYLIALAVGDINYKAISKRSGVYAEKSMLAKAYTEFSDMEKMITTAEKLYGTYAWGQFDVIVLPPSFPFGGMENPRLTFATPTVIAGDKSLTSLIAHELAHSWSGNLVTNATWEDFWLNEGFTVYFETRIMEALYGIERAEMLALIGRQDLEDELEGFKDSPDNTKLKLNLKDRNPDDGMNSIAYDKGYLFLRTLEETVGREKFDLFLKNYFQTHAFSTMYTEKFIDYLNKNLLDDTTSKFNTDEWIYKSGIPNNQVTIVSDKFKKVEKTLQNYLENNSIDTEITKKWTPQEWVHFIRNFPENMAVTQFETLDNIYNLTNSTNSYITMVWFEQSILHNYRAHGIDKKIEKFLFNVGRRWYVTTIFKAYIKSGKIEEARIIYKKSRANYHSVTANTIDKLFDNQQ